VTTWSLSLAIPSGYVFTRNRWPSPLTA
jgi:hypothetical protein